jgi:hypothetical protein
MTNEPVEERRMAAKPVFGSKRFGIPVRYAVAVECADDLTGDERIMMEAWVETVVGQLQRKEELRHTEEEALRWQDEAAGIDPATQREKKNA